MARPSLAHRVVVAHAPIDPPADDQRHQDPVERPGRKPECPAIGGKHLDALGLDSDHRTHRLPTGRKPRSGRPANWARTLYASKPSPRFRAELRNGSVAATSPIANTAGWPGTVNSDVTRTKPASSSNSRGSHSVLGRTRPIVQSTASAVAGGCPVLHCTGALVISSHPKPGEITARCPGCSFTPTAPRRRSTRSQARG